MAEWKEAPPGLMEPEEKVELVMSIIQSPEFLAVSLLAIAVSLVALAMKARKPARRRILDDIYPHIH